MNRFERSRAVGLNPGLESSADLPIWHYLSMTKFIALLETECLWFSRLDRLSDQHEAAISKQAFERSVSEFTSRIGQTGRVPSVDAIREYAALIEAAITKKVRESLLVNCWHMSDVESGAMWAIYGREGVAIQSTINALVDNLERTNHTFEVDAVNYVEHEKDDFPLDQTWLFKHRLFAYEHELRAILIPAEDVGPDPGLAVRISLPSLIHGIYLPPGARTLQRLAVQSLLVRYRLSNIPIVPSAADTVPEYRVRLDAFLKELERESFENLQDKILKKLGY